MAQQPNAVVVTGAASGIGLATAHLLAEAGRPVALWDINVEGVMRAADDIRVRHGVTAVGVGIDLRDFDAPARAAEESRPVTGPFGGLVHAAGTVALTGIDGVTAENWDSVLNIHVRTLVASVQALRADLKASPGAAVVAVASMNGRLGNGMVPAYTAAKGGMISLVRSMADDLAADGIRINSVLPGMIDTPMLMGGAPPESHEALKAELARRPYLGRIGRPEEVGRVIRFLLSDEASYVNATEILVDGGNVPSQRG